MLGLGLEPPDDQIMEWWEEYRYRKLVPMSHEAYLGEPVEAIEWTLRMDNLRAEVDSEWQRKSG